MKQIRIADTTLCQENSKYSFKEKLEIARQLERLNVDAIELPEISDEKADVLFVKTVSSFVKKSVISVAAGSSEQSIENAVLALANAAKPRIRIQLPLSPVGMEYVCHKKAPKMLEWIATSIKTAKASVEDVELCIVDATRVEPDFLKQVLVEAESAGATLISICDSAAKLLPDDFAKFADNIAQQVSVPVGVSCENKNGLATACGVLAARNSVDFVKTAVCGSVIPLETFALMIRDCGDNYGFTTNINNTQLHRIVKQIEWISSNADNEKRVVLSGGEGELGVYLDDSDTQADVISAVSKLGYDISEEDQVKVYEEFLRVATKKKVGAKELDAIVASVALQVPATYKLVSYVINNGNVISSSAQISLNKNDVLMQGVCIGDGPIDAAFRAIDSIIGYHYELDDFQIQSVTEGKEAMGSALVKLRSNGKLYSGNGISTDIIGASIRAYLNAVNKIVYEEA